MVEVDWACVILALVTWFLCARCEGKTKTIALARHKETTIEELPLGLKGIKRDSKVGQWLCSFVKR